MGLKTIHISRIFQVPRATVCSDVGRSCCPHYGIYVPWIPRPSAGLRLLVRSLRTVQRLPLDVPHPRVQENCRRPSPPPRPHSCYHVPYALLLSLEEEDGGKERKYNIQHDLPPSHIDGRTTPCLRQRTGIILGKIDADYHSLSLGTAEQAIFCFSFFPSYRRG